ncbi:MAG TPA: FAD-dependent monooxygenase [Caulobacteraceae bacterium]|jgi:2-polyprenyl-6-methoxyphenol hydroxylase-like FAD-dependent oxidoreductase|nr:FAD-dependent monooxygenase [Caulobacteraceae bacterium]
MAYSDPGRRRTVLISGAGVAGPTLAYWLLRAGLTPVLVERAAAPRTGGYMIDFWGVGFEVAERMGLAPRLKKVGQRIQEVRLVSAAGRTAARLPFDAFSGLLGERYVSLLRGDLAGELLRLVSDRIETRFGDEIVGLQQGEHGVDVMFRRGPPARFDFVVGADGLHSNVRRLAMPDTAVAETPLGYYVASFTAHGYPHNDLLAYVSRTTPGRQVARYALGDGRTAIFMVLAAELGRGRELDTPEAQRRFLAEAFAKIGWEAADIIAALARADDLYFDTVAQVRLPRWSDGRVALVGDAAFCPSLLAGEGAAFAMAGAMVIAGELADAGGAHRPAFERYEHRLRAFIERKQGAARRMGAWFVPRTALGVFVRDQLTRLTSLPGLSSLIAGPMIRDDLALPRYDWLS